MLKSFDQVSEYKLRQIAIAEAEAAEAGRANPSTFVDKSAYDRSPRLAVLWVPRGLLVGTLLGGAYGSVIPLLGTAIGAFVGAFAGLSFGLVIGLVVFVFRLLTRQKDVSEGSTNRIEEALACTMIVAVTLVGSQSVDPDDRIFAFYVPAALGIIHSVLAKPPMPGYIYAGLVTGKRRMAVRHLPLAILACMLCAMCFVWVAAN